MNENMKNLIDARGLSCPEPVLLTKKGLKQYGNGDFCVAVSSATARDNVRALLEGSGLSPQVEENHGGWLIKVPKK